jgi:hypothetical protein
MGGEDVERLRQEAENSECLAQKDERFLWMQQAQEKIFLLLTRLYGL